MNAVGATIRRLVDFASTVEFASLPADVQQITRGLTLDVLGAIAQASSPRYSAGRMLMELARIEGGNPHASIAGGGFKTSCAQAALVNGTLGYYCDVEPHHPGAIMHGMAIVAPTALAIGEREHSSGAEFMSAIVAGIDVACRVANAIDPTALYRRGMHPSCLAGSFGACAAAARLLKLDETRFRHALGLCGTQASGLLAWETDQTEHSRPFNPGIAARNGTTAALLASLGYGGPPDIFEGRFNIFGAFSEKQPDGSWGRPAELTRELGEDFLISGFAVKLYSCCAFLHPGLDALLSILQMNPLRPEEIDQIDLRFPTNGTKLIDDNELKSHCAQYVLPIAVKERRVTIDDILQDRRTDPEIGALSGRVRVVADDDLDRTFPERYATIVEVTTRDGRMLSERVDYARGCPENPVTYAEISAKFDTLARPALGAIRATHVKEMVDAVERVPDVGALADALRDPTAG
ncbi:MAG: MmgE/PrpD family protein [Chloroflexota bacterium]|nr:MAG: MmgE/PrpD family protein [Chloroflexota bacterium]